MTKSKIFNIPNMLCMFRVAIIPFILALFYIDAAWATWCAFILFALGGISDFLDGQIARAMKQTTLLGKFLDSSTDKMLIGVMLFLLVAFGKLDGFWIVPAVIIFLREIFISGVREFMALYNVIIPVSWMAKWKTTVQMLAIGFLILGQHADHLVGDSAIIGKILLLLATVMTVLSGWDYARGAWDNIQKLDHDKDG